MPDGASSSPQRHMRSRKKGLDTYLCHEPTSDRKLQAISHDRRCARCHMNTPDTRKTDPSRRRRSSFRGTSMRRGRRRSPGTSWRTSAAPSCARWSSRT
jgi:hypothetical protein